MSWLWCVEQHCDYYKRTLTREAGLPVDPESLKVTYTDPSSTRVDDRCAFSCARVNYQNWFALHEDSFWIDFSAQRVSSKHLWYAARIQLSVLCFRLIVDWYQSWLSGMLGNVGECAAVESGSGIPSFAALPETRPPQINQISTAEVETFVCDWQISAGGGVKWGALTKRNVNILSCSEDRNHQTAVGTYILYIHNVHTLSHVCSSAKTFLSWQRALSKVMF